MGMLIGYGDGSAVGLYNCPAKIEPQSQTAAVIRNFVVAAVEFFKDFGSIIFLVGLK